MINYRAVAIKLLQVLQNIDANSQMHIDDLVSSTNLTVDDVIAASVILSNQLGFSEFDGSKLIITPSGRAWVAKVTESLEAD